MCLKKLVFHQSTVNALAPSSVYSILPQGIYPRLLSCICGFFLFAAMHVKSLAFCVWEWRRYTQYNIFGQKRCNEGISFMCLICCILQGILYAVGYLLHISSVLILIRAFGWTHFAIQYNLLQVARVATVFKSQWRTRKVNLFQRTKISGWLNKRSFVSQTVSTEVQDRSFCWQHLNTSCCVYVLSPLINKSMSHTKQFTWATHKLSWNQLLDAYFYSRI